MRSGGSFFKDKNGDVKQTHATKLHSEGSRPRNKHGVALDVELPVSKTKKVTKEK